MILLSFHVRNFRRLRDAHITLEPDRTIFVGANNSGKTSAAHALSLFLREDKFLMYDFSAEAWNKFDDVAKRDTKAANDPVPSISVDLWFQIVASDLHRVIEMVPDLNWEIGPVGVRIELAVKSPAQLLANFIEARKKAAAPEGKQEKDNADYSPWPRSVTDYLIKRFDQEFEFRYFVLDRSQFDEKFNAKLDYVPQPLGDGGRSGSKILQSLIRVSFMKAQRHMAGEGASDRAEDLSRRLGRFYESHLKQHEADYDALRALANSESQLNQHFESVFKPTLDRLGQLGYPGLTEAQLLIRAVVDARQLLKGDANVHYALGNDGEGADKLLLPDKYNGLGYKNLIYMVIELLDYHSRWANETEDRALLHLVLIEEPEAHLHTQLQQVFIREVQRILPDDSGAGFSRQLVVTTHSPHILYAAGFTPIRYFRRVGGPGRKQHSQVLNLSEFYRTSEKESRDFLQRYMELTHCDLFFADAAILVEGTVERLLMPAMVHKSAPSLESCYLSVLEVGGAYGHISLPDHRC
jgi:predicted ATP-dependent endonuclease of OLD family